jgi:hypothetical protein
MTKLEKVEANNESDIGINLVLMRAAVRFNALMLGITGGTLAALIVFFATHLSIAKWGSDAGSYLGLLNVFFPGFSVTSGGAWVGAFWAFVYAGIFASLSYLLYGMALGARLGDYIKATQPTENPVTNPSILRLHGTSLGLALGTTMSLALFLSTSWLVVRGTAGDSVHAALLVNYLPGYSVSIQGGFVGAIGLFAIVFLACQLMAWVYNKIVELRHQ